VNDFIAGLVFFGVGYWLGRSSSQYSRFGEVVVPDPDSVYLTEDDPRPLKTIPDPFGGKRLVLRKGCRYRKMFQCKKGAL